MTYAQPSAAAPGSRPKGLAVAALVLGIIGLLGSLIVVGGALSLVALVLGIVAVRKANAGEADGKGLAVGGIVTGVLGMVVALLIAVTVGSFIAGNADEIGDYADCVNKANGDQTEIQACADQFERDLNP